MIALSSGLGEKGQELRDQYLFWLASILSEGNKSVDLSSVLHNTDFTALTACDTELLQPNPDAQLRRWRAVFDCAKASVADGGLSETMQDSLVNLLSYVGDEDVQKLWAFALEDSARTENYDYQGIEAWPLEKLDVLINRLGTHTAKELWEWLIATLPAFSESSYAEAVAYDVRDRFSLCCKYFTKTEIDAALAEAMAIQFEPGKLNVELVLKLNLYGALLSHVGDLDKTKIIRELISMLPTVMLEEGFPRLWLDLIANEVGAINDDMAHKVWQAFTDKEAWKVLFAYDRPAYFGIALRPFATKLTNAQRTAEFELLCERISSLEIGELGDSVNVAIWALSPHLNDSQRSELWDACWMRLTPDFLAHHAFYDTPMPMGFLFALLEPYKRNEARALMFERFGFLESHETLLELLGIENPNDKFELCFAELTDSQFEFLSSILLPTINGGDWQFRLENAICSKLSDERKELRAKEIVQRCVRLSWASQPSPLRFIRDARFLAETLRNPTIPLSTLQDRLMRFEELVLYEGRNVFLDVSSDKADAKQAVPIRQFLTPHDVAKWIKSNWPDVDLDGYGTPLPPVVAPASQQ